MAKIKFKVNLENFMNMTIIPSSDNKEESYKEALDVLKDWEEYSVYAVMVANNIRKALGIKEREIVEEAKAIINNLQNEEKPLPKSEVAETKNAGSKYHVDPKYYAVLSAFEIACIATFRKYETNGWELSDKQQKIWSAIGSKIRKAKGG